MQSITRLGPPGNGIVAKRKARLQPGKPGKPGLGAAAGGTWLAMHLAGLLPLIPSLRSLPPLRPTPRRATPPPTEITFQTTENRGGGAGRRRRWRNNWRGRERPRKERGCNREARNSLRLLPAAPPRPRLGAARAEIPVSRHPFRSETFPAGRDTSPRTAARRGGRASTRPSSATTTPGGALRPQGRTPPTNLFPARFFKLSPPFFGKLLHFSLRRRGLSSFTLRSTCNAELGVVHMSQLDMRYVKDKEKARYALVFWRDGKKILIFSCFKLIF